ncbi:MAG: Zn-ribbon domain-containing OB-fold protein [Candidatus Bathyarchaeia archaeon]
MMCENTPFTVASFYGFLCENRLMAAKCKKCGAVNLPPKPMCTKCCSTDLEWNELEGTGKLLSYTVIHVAPEQYQSMAPYVVGIIEFEKGVRLPGIIRNVNPDEVRIGIKLKIESEHETCSQWPRWSKYYFNPL